MPFQTAQRQVELLPDIAYGDFQMITWHEELTFDFSDPVSNEVFTENCIFFDIETTGFSPARTDLYLIGCATRRDSLLCIDQFFSENAADQKNVLSAFLELLSGYDTILTFNGIGFDIPYLKAKCKALHLSDPFDAHSYIDLYKEVSRFKFLFALTSYKQKSIELFLGIDRIDAYSGGELIEVYKEYVRHPQKIPTLLKAGTTMRRSLYVQKLLPVSPYPKLWEQAFSLQSLEASEYRSMDGASATGLFFTLALRVPRSQTGLLSYDDCYLSHGPEVPPGCVLRLFEENFFRDGIPKTATISLRRISQFTKYCIRRRQRTPRAGERASCYGQNAIFLFAV